MAIAPVFVCTFHCARGLFNRLRSNRMWYHGRLLYMYMYVKKNIDLLRDFSRAKSHIYISITVWSVCEARFLGSNPDVVDFLFPFGVFFFFLPFLRYVMNFVVFLCVLISLIACSCYANKARNDYLYSCYALIRH